MTSDMQASTQPGLSGMTSPPSFRLDGGSLNLHRAMTEQAQDAVIFADRGGIIQAGLRYCR
jgi:hypothetical protein